MKVWVLVLLCVLGAALLASVRCEYSSGPKECCFRFYEGKIPAKKIKSYTRTDERCSRPGAILVTQKLFRACVNPYDSWVRQVIKTVDKRNF